MNKSHKHILEIDLNLSGGIYSFKLCMSGESAHTSQQLDKVLVLGLKGWEDFPKGSSIELECGQRIDSPTLFKVIQDKLNRIGNNINIKLCTGKE